ncbi:hypothetical protein DFH05DRAFT_1454991 [Lentinula detonsa]|uniref:Uncharacterized protein n=1 Tax=Lentinula detonsa TaxID=2804962 RepID=A0A9W8NNQ5_9AGAR|nr:hypothetical protein DFH05DRAFT_1454991 [Lentinula detonsa]
MYHCKTCAAISITEGRLMKRGSVKEHLISAKHLRNFKANLLKKQQEEAEHNKYSRTYLTAVLAKPNPDFQARPASPRPDMFSGNVEYSSSDFEVSNILPDDVFLHPESPQSKSDVDEFLRSQYEMLLNQALHLDEFGPDDDSTDDMVSYEEDDDEADECDTNNSQSLYFPYPNKVAMLLDILDNLPRLRLSSNSVKLILWMLKELGISGVPSFNSFRKMQDSLQKQSGITPEAHISEFKNHFHSVNPRDWVAHEFANPHVAPHINLYPERTDGPRSETWQFERWTEFSPAQLTPMMTRGLRQFWITEVAQLNDGSYVIPHNWIYVTTAGTKVLSSDCSDVQVTPHGWTILDSQRTIPSTQFCYNYDDIISQIGDKIHWQEGIANVPEMPNKLRNLAEGEDLLVVMLPLWCDDVSGNKSKQYNKHINIYSVNGSLPGQLLQQEYFVNFLSTSPNATPLEQFKTLCDQIKETETNPVRCYNAHTGRMCRCILRVPMLPADNPAQAEEASQNGGNSNHPCRKCKVGGGHQDTESPDGYHSFFCDTESLRRSANEIKTELTAQLHAAMTGVESTVTKMQTASGTKDKITQHWIDELISKARHCKETTNLSEDEIIEELKAWLEAERGEKMNPLLDLTGLDPSQDTPIEILHTILLGIVKYVWHMLNTTMSEKELELLAVRLQSTNVDGLKIPPLRAAYMIQYRNNLIGKHFKTLMQILPFHIHNFAKLGSAHLTLIRSVSALGAHLWIPEIQDLDQYLNDLMIFVGNVLDAFADIDASKILVKIKIHLLTHLKSDVQRFGPPIRYSTEVFEGFNAVFRLCSIYSNHQAPSRDIAYQFASMGRLKHLLSGGFFQIKISQTDFKWVQAGAAVQNILLKVPIIQRHLGWVPSGPMQPAGMFGNAGSIPWTDSMASKYTSDIPPPTMQWLVGESPKVTSITGDLCTVGSWVFATSVICSSNDRIIIGRIAEILLQQGSSASSGIITIEQFDLGSEVHEDFHCPILHKPSAPKFASKLNILKAIQFCASVQHDCRLAKCQPNRRVHLIQERQRTERTHQLLEHADDDNFIINMYALHNATLLRDALPRELWKPIPLYKDRQARHNEIAQTLVVTQTEKRQRAREKAQATRERRKAAAATQSAVNPQAGKEGRQRRQDNSSCNEDNAVEDGHNYNEGEEQRNGSNKRRRR